MNNSNQRWNHGHSVAFVSSAAKVVTQISSWVLYVLLFGHSLTPLIGFIPFNLLRYSHINWPYFGRFIDKPAWTLVKISHSALICKGYSTKLFILSPYGVFNSLTAFRPNYDGLANLDHDPYITIKPPISPGQRSHSYRSVLYCSLHLYWMVRMLPVLL